jgi:hypothetical protein
MTEELNPIIQILVAFVGTGGGAAALIALGRELWRSRKSRKMDRGFLDIAAVWEETQTLAAEVGASRVLVLKSENGGGLPAPGSVIKSSVVFEYRTGELPAVRSLWQQVLLDSHYSEVLSVVSTGAWTWSQTGSMPEGCIMRDLCGDGLLVGTARICKTEQALWYLSVHFKSADATTAKIRSRIRASLFKMRILFGKHHKLLTGEAT